MYYFIFQGAGSFGDDDESGLNIVVNSHTVGAPVHVVRSISPAGGVYSPGISAYGPGIGGHDLGSGVGSGLGLRGGHGGRISYRKISSGGYKHGMSGGYKHGYKFGRGMGGYASKFGHGKIGHGKIGHGKIGHGKIGHGKIGHQMGGYKHGGMSYGHRSSSFVEYPGRIGGGRRGIIGNDNFNDFNNFNDYNNFNDFNNFNDYNNFNDFNDGFGRRGSVYSTIRG